MEKKYKDDYEDDDDSSEDINTVNFLEKKQRELITSTIDYNLESLSQLMKKRTIDLAPKYQRRFRWDEKRKSKLIESFLMNVPIPPIFLNEDDYGEYSVIDGKQRLSSINDFLSGDLQLTGLEVFKDLNGLNFYDLPKTFQNVIKTRGTLRAIIVLRQSDKEIKYEVFQRLNTGGVKLNAQEIRNSAFPGILNDTLICLSEKKKFRRMLGIKSKKKSRIYLEMKDVELVLRFSALKDSWMDYGGGLKKILDSYADNNRNMNKDGIDIVTDDFNETLEKLETIFGEDGVFRRWMPDKKKWKQQISIPIFDAQMFACFGKNIKKLKENKRKIISGFKKIFTTDATFLESISSSTATPKRFIYRIEIIQKLFS